MTGLIDKKAEIARLSKLIGKLESELAKSQARLANEKFVVAAPASVVEKERARVSQQHLDLQTLQTQLEHVRAL